MARMVVNPGSPAAWEFQLKPGPNFIGRGFANDFKVPDPSVSGSHCEVVVVGGTATIRDLGSTNGTYVNGVPVKEGVLQTGQSIRIGEVEMLFYGDQPAAESRSGAKSGPIKVTLVPAPVPAPSGVTARIAPAQAPPPPSVPEPPPPMAMPARRVAAVATPIPVASAAAAVGAFAAGEGPCKFHPKTAGRFFCRQCQNFFCELCVTSRAAAGVQHKFCRHCGAECLAVHATPTPKVNAEKSFFARLPGAFIYPLQGSGLLMLLVAALLFSGMKFIAGWLFLPAWLLLQAVFLGYLFSFLQNIIHATAAEERELPPLPGMANFWEDLILPSLKLLGLVLFCWGPAFLLEVLTISSEDSFLGTLIFPVGILGGIYFPMAFLAVAILDSVAAVNPLQVIPSIFKVPLEYLVTLILLGAVWGLRMLGELVLPIVFPRGIITHSVPKLMACLAAQAFWGLASLYLLTVGVHILGLLYVTKKEKLGWLGH